VGGSTAAGTALVAGQGQAGGGGVNPETMPETGDPVSDAVLGVYHRLRLWAKVTTAIDLHARDALRLFQAELEPGKVLDPHEGGERFSPEETAAFRAELERIVDMLQHVGGATSRRLTAEMPDDAFGVVAGLDAALLRAIAEEVIRELLAP
jgi:hypothetical protein